MVEGLDGWLFLQNDSNSVSEQSTGRLQLTEQQLAGWVRLLENRAAWTAMRGIPYHFFIAPNKESVYPQFLPEGYRLHGDRPVTRFLAACSDGLSVDHPMEELRLLSERELLYPKGDTH